MHPSLFVAEMEFLARGGYQVISLRQACSLLSSSADLRRKIVLTFDDGYLDFLTTAAPVLKEHGFAATVFILAADCRDGAQHPEWRPQASLLNHDQIKQVAAMGFSLGSHTLTHSDLTALDVNSLNRELCESRAAIEALGETFFAFAYPGGRFTRRERNAVERAGYDCAVIVGGRWGNGKETDRFLLRREPMLASDTYDRFKQRVNGYYEWHYLFARARGIKTR